MSIFFLFATAAFFLLNGKLKDIIIHFLYKICNDTLLVLSVQSSDSRRISSDIVGYCRIMSTDITRYY